MTEVILISCAFILGGIFGMILSKFMLGDGMDTKKAIMFLAGLIERLNLPHSGSTLHDEE